MPVSNVYSSTAFVNNWAEKSDAYLFFRTIVYFLTTEMNNEHFSKTLLDADKKNLRQKISHAETIFRFSSPFQLDTVP